MTDTVIKVENLSKQYRIGSAEERNKTFRETLVGAAKAPFLRVQEAWRKGSHSQPQAPRSPHAEGISPLSAPSSPLSSHDDFIWALKDVSFEIKRGEVVGVIGRNGAGKSTLLKILARITEPTEGKITLRGRVGSLLEVGTGFHSELTGEENIYLSGTILGMSSREISNKFDEIVSFAEMEKFINTPVKHYSSGMYMRLAFAVAAHMETEILLVDEVLAVGDAEFQKKCLGKMGDVSKQGRTVLFVSHNMGAIRTLCQKGILLKNGQIYSHGKTDEIIDSYMSSIMDAQNGLGASKVVESMPRVKSSDEAKIVHIKIQNKTGHSISSFSVWEPIIVDLTIRISQTPITVSPWILIHSSDGIIVLSAFQYDSMDPVKIECEECIIRVYIDPNGLKPGRYSISAGVFGKHNECYDWVDEVIKFDIKKEFISGKVFDGRLGEIILKYRWETL